MTPISFSQSLINLLLTTTAVTNVWDNDKDVSGLSELEIFFPLAEIDIFL